MTRRMPSVNGVLASRGQGCKISTLSSPEISLNSGCPPLPATHNRRKTPAPRQLRKSQTSWALCALPRSTRFSLCGARHTSLHRHWPFPTLGGRSCAVRLSWPVLFFANRACPCSCALFETSLPSLMLQFCCVGNRARCGTSDRWQSQIGTSTRSWIGKSDPAQAQRQVGGERARLLRMA